MKFLSRALGGRLDWGEALAAGGVRKGCLRASEGVREGAAWQEVRDAAGAPGEGGLRGRCGGQPTPFVRKMLVTGGQGAEDGSWKLSYLKPVQQYSIEIQYCQSPGIRRGRMKAVLTMATLDIAGAVTPPVQGGPTRGGATRDGATREGAGRASSRGLRAGARGLVSSVVIAVPPTAPAYSMAATLGLIVAVVGVHSPGTLIVSFLPMLCVAYAFRELNKADPDCGTTFTWTARAFGPRAGWMGGWGIIAADVIVMASLAQIAGRYFMQLVGLQRAGTVWVTVAGVAFIALLTAICYRGIEVSARLQQVLLVIEVGALAVFAIVALVKAGTGHALPGAAHPSAAWLSPWTGSFGSLSNSFLLAVFIYWGWDCCLSVNEETKDSARTPGRAAVMATLMLVAIFAVVSVAALAYAGPAFLASHSTDVLGAMATSVLGSAPGKLLVLCVLTSTAASCQTTIMPTARAVLAMSSHGAIPRWFARMHPRFRTPTTATVVMGAVSALFYVLLTAMSKNVLADSAASVGLLIA